MAVCGWCQETATHVVVVFPGGEMIRGKRKVWRAEQTQPVCEVHANQFVLRGKEVRGRES